MDFLTDNGLTITNDGRYFYLEDLEGIRFIKADSFEEAKKLGLEYIKTCL